MALRLDSRSPSFPRDFAALLAMKREVSEDVDAAARAIIEDVIARGDAALVDYTRRFDRLSLDASGLRIGAAEVDAAMAACAPDALAALRLAHERIAAFHARQMPADDRFVDSVGVEMGHRWTAVEAVGLYVPGGTASYPSSVLMNAVPARVAGVPRIVMVVPTPDGVLSPLVLAAARIAGVNEIYRVGGAQAVAALAYGTATIAPVAKIVGPGNAYVAAAKRRVFGQVGIDMIAGPSEVVVLADDTANADWIAADLLAQAEHDTAAQSILVTDSDALADAVAAAVEGRLRTLPRAEIAGASWRDFGAVVLVPSLAEAVPLVDRLAPEHLEIVSRDADALAGSIRNAGAIFIGG
ncbi:MAG: histidinol dehydrogenase, partial [Alsobacter sp.]